MIRPTRGWLQWFANILIAVFIGLAWHWLPEFAVALFVFVVLNNFDMVAKTRRY